MPWDQILPLAGFLSIALVMALLMRRRIDADAARPEQARALCGELGFTFIVGTEARARNLGPSAVPRELAALERLPDSMKSGLLEDASWRGEGVLDGVRVAVYDELRPTSNHFRTILVVRAYRPEGSAGPIRAARGLKSDAQGAFREKANGPLDARSVRAALRHVADAVREGGKA